MHKQWTKEKKWSWTHSHSGGYFDIWYLIFWWASSNETGKCKGYKGEVHGPTFILVVIVKKTSCTTRCYLLNIMKKLYSTNVDNESDKCGNEN